MVIKPNDGKQRDTISARRWKIKLCNESTDVICTLSAGRERQHKKDRGSGRESFLQIDREMKKFVNSAVLVTARSVAIVAFSLRMHDSSKLFFFLSCFVTLFLLLDGTHEMVQT